MVVRYFFLALLSFSARPCLAVAQVNLQAFFRIFKKEMSSDALKMYTKNRECLEPSILETRSDYNEKSCFVHFLLVSPKVEQDKISSE